MASSATSTPNTTPTPTPTPTPTSATPSSSSTTPQTSASPTSTTPPTSNNTTPTSPVQQTTPNSGTTSAGTSSNPAQSTSNGPASSASDTSLAADTSSIATTLSVASTTVGESAMLETSSNGQVFTTTVQFTSTILPGSVITAPPLTTPSNNKSNTGAIVGGVVGGIAAVLLFTVLVFFCLRKRRKDEFDGNFDPANVGSVKGGGGGTLPKIDLGESGLLMNNGGVEEDDGMGGRLGSGPEGGGIITPYAFQPAPIGGGMAVGGQQYQNQQPQQMSNIGVAGDGVAAAAAVSATGYPNEKRTMRQQQQQYGQHTPNQSVSSGSLYPSSSHANHNMNPNGVSPEPYSATSDGASSVGGGSGGVYYQSMARGPSPGPSVLSSSSGGRHAKEMEAMGRVIANPDGGQQQQQQQQLPAFQQSYLQTGPGPHQQQQHPQYVVSSPSSSSTAQYPLSSHSPTPSRAGTAVVVHEDGGRVVLRKGEGEEAEGEREVLSPEIPPTYESLPVGVRRDS